MEKETKRCGIKRAKTHSIEYRTVWISDVHLGLKGCQAEVLLDFLSSVEIQTLYLVGDIVDVWQMRKRVYWPQAHSNLLRKVMGLAKEGTKVIYIPGNHDELFRAYDGVVFGNIEIKNSAVHTLKDGRRMLVMHGDELDAVVQSSRLVAMAGSKLYDWLLDLNYWINLVRRKLGFRYWSLAACLKHKVKNAVSYIGNYEKALAYEAEKASVDGIICGHIHHAEISRIGQITYCNTGDWVESCTALTEDSRGALEIVSWLELAEKWEEMNSNKLEKVA